MRLTDVFPDDATIDLERFRKIGFPREAVWEWMLGHPCELLSIDPLHARVEVPGLPLEKGDRILIHHEFPLGYRERRYAQINKIEPYVIGFGELTEEGRFDYFPHSYRFSVADLDSESCVVGFHLRGRFRFPAARWWWMPWFRQIAPARFEDALDELEASIREGLREHRPPATSPRQAAPLDRAPRPGRKRGTPAT